MDRRRLLLLVTDLEIGGTPTVVRELAIRLRRHARIEVACLKGWGPVAGQLRDAGIAVTTLGAQTGWSSPRVVTALVRHVRSQCIDTVFSFLVHANAVAAAALVWCPRVRGIQSIQTTHPEPAWHWRVQAIAQHVAERVVVPSASAAESARRWGRVPLSRLVVIPNAVDPPPAVLPAAVRVREGAFRLGFVGRLDPVKRVPGLIAQLALLRDWQMPVTLDIFGDGPDRQAVERQIIQHGVQEMVHLHGTIENPASVWQRIDCLILPSRAEGFGLVLIEAMAAGVPVIATNVPGIRDVVRDGCNGLLTDVRSGDGIAVAVKRLIDDPALRSRLIEQGAASVRARFTWDVVLPEYLKLLRLT